MLFFGKKKHKEQIHAQAVDLMHEWNEMLQASGNNLSFGMSEEEIQSKDDSEMASLMLEYSMALLGILTYMVAGMQHVEAAQEMVEVFKDLFAQYDDDMNPKGLLPEEAAINVNEYYRKAANVSESLMASGKGLEDIIYAFANDIFKWIDSGFDEADINFMEGILVIFYEDTYKKYNS